MIPFVKPLVPMVMPMVPLALPMVGTIGKPMVPLGNPEQSQCQVLAGRDHNEVVDDTINNYCFVLLVSGLQLLPS